MDLEGALTFVEHRARGYILHILGFLGPNSNHEKPHATVDEEVLIYGLISLAIGVALQDLYIAQTPFDKINFVGRFIGEIGFWIFLSLIIHLILNVGGKAITYSISMVATLSVMPTAFVIGSYGAFLAYHAARYFGGTVQAPYAADLVDLLAQLFVIIRYLPRALSQGELAGRSRRGAATALIALLVGTIDFTTIYQINGAYLGWLVAAAFRSKGHG